MVVFALDTNFVFSRIIHKRERNIQTNMLDRILYLQSKGLLKLSFHKATQAELYAILRAGRIKVRNREGKKENFKFPHHVIMLLVRKYKDLFDVEFMNSLDKVGLDNAETYKELLFKEVEYHLGMKIKQSREYLENKRIVMDNCKDPYDYHIMVSAIQDSADYLVTENTKDFPNPMGKCQIISSKELYEYLPIHP